MALRRTIALLPSRFPPSTSTAATGCGWRRLISDGSGRTQDLAKTADATEAAAYAAKAAAAYADAARKAAEDAYAAKKAAANADPANKIMISRAVSAVRTDFQRKVAAAEIHYNVELCSFETKFNKAVKDSMSAMKGVDDKCFGGSHSFLTGCDVLREKQEIFSRNLQDRVTLAQISLLKNMAWLASVGVGLAGLYLRAKGDSKGDPKA